ncbi:P4Hc [Seminavis robusta]|uniref:P4Hc n=1 Tax=Seminavis robusta TaxID=568900 RepID=A0A9N8HIJ5_9STRA|nr:P4Hc [Seminavis robusta]|eukprot:Sro504_g156020.1 P4Hc (419) ;mRNA; r:42187-43617
MRCAHHRQQTPFRQEIPQVQTARISQATTQQNHKVMVEAMQRHRDGAVRTHVGAYDEHLPSIALSLSSSSSSSSSSVTSTSATIDVGSFPNAKPTATTAASVATQQKRYPSAPYYPPYYASHHRVGPSSSARGMVLASPPQKTPPTARVPKRGHNDINIRSPPKLLRVTSLPARCHESRFAFTPFALDGRYSDQELQQLQEMRSRSGGYYPNYCCSYPPPPHPYPMASHPESFIHSGYRCAPEVIGHPSLRIFKLRLPMEHLARLDRILEGCEAHAKELTGGWRTELYSLTQQDLALTDIPGMMDIAMPILQYLSRCICEVSHAEAVRVDRNQPHVLKYDQNHTGVELHHDRCDVTANLMMSRSHTYVGGGTYFPEANTVVRLKFGEFLLHPGQLIHGGTDITRGTRYLMVLFAHLKK